MEADQTAEPVWGSPPYQLFRLPSPNLHLYHKYARKRLAYLVHLPDVMTRSTICEGTLLVFFLSANPRNGNKNPDTKNHHGYHWEENKKT